MQPRLRFLISGLLAALVFGAGYCVAVVVPGAGDTTVHDYTSFYASDSRMTAEPGQHSGVPGEFSQIRFDRLSEEA